MAFTKTLILLAVVCYVVGVPVAQTGYGMAMNPGMMAGINPALMGGVNGGVGMGMGTGMGTMGTGMGTMGAGMGVGMPYYGAGMVGFKDGEDKADKAVEAVTNKPAITETAAS